MALVRRRRFLPLGAVGGAVAYGAPIIYRRVGRVVGKGIARFFRGQLRAAETEMPRRLGYGAGLGPGKRSRTDDTKAPLGVLPGSRLTVGGGTSHIRNHTKYGRKPRSKFVAKKFIFRWQSIVPTKNLDRALPLNIVESPTRIDMPMYAFNLSSFGGQDRAIVPVPQSGGGTVSKPTDLFARRNIPMYRLSKIRPAGSWIDPNVQNYTWYPVLGYNNLPGYNGFGSTNNDVMLQGYGVTHDNSQDCFAWQHEMMDDVPGTVDYVRHMWSQVKLLVNCSEQDCRIHIAIAKFVLPEAGPVRQHTILDYKVNGVGGYLGPTGVVETGFILDDTNRVPPADEVNDSDCFWENFWGHRAVHPLANTNPADKTKCVKYLKHEIIQKNATLTNELTTSLIEKTLFFGSGRYEHLQNNVRCDTERRGDVANAGLANCPLVQNYSTNAPYPVLGDMLGYNQIVRPRSNSCYQDRYKDCWLLIWMDMPKTYNNQSGKCTFDIVVRNKFEVDNHNYRTTGPNYQFDSGTNSWLQSATDPYA